MNDVAKLSEFTKSGDSCSDGVSRRQSLAIASRAHRSGGVLLAVARFYAGARRAHSVKSRVSPTGLSRRGLPTDTANEPESVIGVVSAVETGFPEPGTG